MPSKIDKTAQQRIRRFRDKACSIDDELNKAICGIDWVRRNNAEKSLIEWVATYCVPLLLNDPPPELGNKVLGDMERTITAHEKYMICMGRGSGKTSYVECATLYAIATGKQKFVVIVSANQRAASNILSDLWRAVIEKDTTFSQDYPEICAPFQLTNGGFRRRQLYNGISTDLTKNASELVFARLRTKDGYEVRTSGSVISCRGITSGIRGMKHGNLRPTYAILDDLQSSDDARSPEAVNKLMESINKDIIPLGGKERLSILQTATPICPDDLVEKIKGDKSWRTTIYPAIIQFPTKTEMWNEYFKQWDDENATETDHKSSLQFYKEHQAEMDDGAKVFNPTRYSKKDGHISAIQKLLEIKHTLGDSVFDSEYQMNPQQLQFALSITPKLVASRTSNLNELQIPEEGVRCVVASSDLNLSKAITTTIVAFMSNQTATVIYHKFRKCRIPVNIPEQDYYRRVYNLLGEHGRELKKLADEHHLNIDAWAIDANGQNWNAVLDFTNNSRNICELPACGFVGKASHQFRSFISSRLKEEVNRTLLCGDDNERKKYGTGRRWTYFDSDLYHERVQKGFLQEVGNIGSLTWYQGGNHSEWSIQVCGEKLLLKKARQDGATEYHWKEISNSHDALDSIGQAFAAYATFGYSDGSTGRTSLTTSRRVFKKRYKII